MLKAKLLRIENNDSHTFGVLLIGDRYVCTTLENPWRNNKRNLSCIPEGIYTCKRYDSHKYGQTWQITNVCERSYILFHYGNYVRNTDGCVLVGNGYSYDEKEGAMITSSKVAFARLVRMTSDIEEFELEIVRA